MFLRYVTHSDFQIINNTVVCYYPPNGLASALMDYMSTTATVCTIRVLLYVHNILNTSLHSPSKCMDALLIMKQLLPNTTLYTEFNESLLY